MKSYKFFRRLFKIIKREIENFTDKKMFIEPAEFYRELGKVDDKYEREAELDERLSNYTRTDDFDFDDFLTTREVREEIQQELDERTETIIESILETINDDTANSELEVRLFEHLKSEMIDLTTDYVVDEVAEKVIYLEEKIVRLENLIFNSDKILVSKNVFDYLISKSNENKKA